MPDEREYGGNADMEQDVTAIRRVALAFLAVVVICIGLAVFLTHKSIPNRPQASVVATPSSEINTAESEGKAATSIEDNTAPSHSVLDQDWRPYLKGTLDDPAPEAPVADEAPDTSDVSVTEAPVVPAPAADEPVVEAPVADVAQPAHDRPARRHRHRPHHYHRPLRHDPVCAVREQDFAVAFSDAVDCLAKAIH